MARLRAALLLFVRSVAARDCYATIVYGSEPKHVCTAAVLGRALRWLDPWKARVALVSNVAPNASAVLREEYELAPAKWRGDAGRKADLFNGPGGCDRVIYLDADCMPLSSWARIENVWKQLEGGAAVVATRQGRTYENYKHYDGCFNGGFLAVKRNERVHRRYVQYTKTFTRQRGAWSRVDPRQRIGTKSIPCHGTDQGFLNLAVKEDWAVANFSVHFAATCLAQTTDVVHAGRGGLKALLAHGPTTLPRGPVGGPAPPGSPGPISGPGPGGTLDWCRLWWDTFAALPEPTRAFCSDTFR